MNYLIKREKEHRGNLQQAKFEKKLVLKMLKYLYKAKKDIKNHDTLYAYNNASLSAQISVKYLRMRQPRYWLEDSKRLCINKEYLYWYSKIFVLNTPLHEKTVLIPALTGDKQIPCTTYYVNGVNNEIDRYVIQSLGIHLHNWKDNFKSKELKDCLWANDRVIKYIKENLQLINADLKADLEK